MVSRSPGPIESSSIPSRVRFSPNAPGEGVVPLGDEASDRLHRVEADRLVDAPVARLGLDVTVIGEAQAAYPLLGHRQLRDATLVDVDADHAA